MYLRWQFLLFCLSLFHLLSHSEPIICFTINSSFTMDSLPMIKVHSPFQHLCVCVCVCVYSEAVAIYRDIYQNLQVPPSSLDQFALHCLVSLCLTCLLSIAQDNLYCRPVFSYCNWALQLLAAYFFILFDWQLHSDTDPTTDPLFPEDDLSLTLKISR